MIIMQIPTGVKTFQSINYSSSDIRQYNCPGMDSKSRTVMLNMAEMLPRDWEID
jgi:hypothetical protein